MRRRSAWKRGSERREAVDRRSSTPIQLDPPTDRFEPRASRSPGPCDPGAYSRTVLKTSHQSSARSRSHGVVLPQSCSASESARAVAKRSAGSFARQRINTASRSAGTVCPGADGEGGVDETTQNHIATECPQLPDREDNIGHRHARPLRTDRLRRWPGPAAISVTQLFSHEHWGNQRRSDGRRRLARHLLKSMLAES